MAIDKAIDSAAHKAELKLIADSIRAKGGTTAQFASAAEMKAAVDAIKVGGGSTSLETLYLNNAITEIHNSEITKITATHVLGYFENLTTLDLPNVTEITGDYFCYNCINLSSVNFPKLLTMGPKAFANNIGLKKVTLPAMVEEKHALFTSCKGLEIVDLPKIQKFSTSSFAGSSNLKTLILRSETQVRSSGGNNFDFVTECPNIKVYVPRALLSRYNGEGNWNPWYRMANKNLFLSIEDYPEITGG